VKATPEHQRRLLDIADLDRRIAVAERASRTPAQGARITELAALRQRQLGELTTLAGVLDDARAEQARLASDVSLASQRRDKNSERLATATDAKQAQALESEIESLGRRIRMLEDAELEVMERVEQAQSAVDAQQNAIDQTQVEGGRLTAEAKSDMTAAAAERDQLVRDRSAIVETLPGDLVAEYARRASRGGAGAGLLRRRVCEGCQMVLAGSDLNAVRAAAADDVVSCPECDAILVRTDESGL